MDEMRAPDHDARIARVARNTAAYSAATIARIAIGLVLVPLLIGGLGTDAYGTWSLATTFSVSGYLTLLTLGLQGILVRDVAAAHARGDSTGTRRAISTALVAYAFAGVAGALVIASVATFLDLLFRIPAELLATARVALLLLALQALIDFPALALDGALEGLQRYGLRSALEIARLAAFAIGAVIVVASGAGLVGLAMVSLAVALASAPITYAAVWSSAPAARSLALPRLAEVMRSVREATGLFAIRLNAVVYSQMDRSILAAMVSSAAIAHYDIAARIHSVALVPQSMPAAVVLPAAAAAAAVDDRPAIRELFLTLTRYNAAASALVTLGLMLLAAPIIRDWIGVAFLADTALAQLFLSYTLVWVLVQVGWSMMVAVGQIRPIVRISLVTTALNAVLSVVLTAALGVSGVIWGTVLGNLVAAILYLRLYLSVLDIPAATFVAAMVRPYAAPALAAALLAVMLRLREPANLGEVAAYLLAYMSAGAVLVLILVPRGDERARIGAVVRSALRLP